VRTAAKSELYRKLPSLDELLRSPELIALASEEGQAAVADAARMVLACLRDEISASNPDEAALDSALFGLADTIARQLRRNLQYSLRPVINATGVILHTNLGRAPLPALAIDHIRDTATAYSNLEFDIPAGERGKRDVHVDRLFCKLLTTDDPGIGVSAPQAHVGTAASAVQPSEARQPGPSVSTIVVNNNAAAVLLALNALAEAGEVIVSRGELVEIGGSFRIPEIMAKSGAILREVGTTNRTRLADYEQAIGDKTRLLLRVHRSNFQITGFTEQPSLQELVELARKRGIPLMEDLGSGALFDLSALGITGEPGILDSLRAGVDVVTYSGDKLLGGPQAGMLSGRPELISRMRSNSLFRALRVDKLTYAALEATLLAYVKRDHDAIPTLCMMGLSKEEVAKRAQAVAGKLQSPKLVVELADGESVIGGGAAPSAVLATRLLAVTAKNLSADELAARLRACDPPVIARVEEGRVLLDLRTVFPEQDEAVATALNHAAKG
jgi:L-seryl-tRNA(Ser) seleniumtransferase